MMNRLSLWWADHSLRDRWAIGVLAMATLIVIGWLGVWRPLSDALDKAGEAHDQAIERHAAITARVAELQSLRQRGGRPPDAPTGRIDLVIAQSAAERGFTLSRNDAVGDSATTLAIASASAPALFGWLGQLEEQGIVASELTIRPNGNGTVALTAQMRVAR